jgi:uncharacterized membrane protein YgaE (UPF0421/DUF939 family)
MAEAAVAALSAASFGFTFVCRIYYIFFFIILARISILQEARSSFAGVPEMYQSEYVSLLPVQ